MRTLALFGAVAAILAAPASAAEPVPRKGDCPPGYWGTGSYCVPSQPDAPKAILRIGNTCPPAYYQSGSYCVESRPDAPAVIEKRGGCPDGFRSVGSYCVRRD